MKRLVDVVGALVGLLVLSPALIGLGAWILLSDFGPVLFRQTRVGRGGRLFTLYKFRTMVVGADRLGPLVTAGGDPRVTKIGRTLRRFKLDEFPQLANVLFNQISLVGPRPEVPAFVETYSEDERRVLALKPGITDPASFAFYDEEEWLKRAGNPAQFYRQFLVPEKIRLNLDYAAKANILTDLFLIVATLLKVGGVDLDVLKILDIAAPVPPGE